MERVNTTLALRRARSAAREIAGLKAQRDRLLRAQLQRERLSALLVHDLKAPLNTISLIAQGLLRSKTITPADRDAAEEINVYTHRLSSMIMNLLDISKSKNDGLSVHCEPLDARELCENVLRDFDVVARASQVSLQTLRFVPSLYGDPTLLRRVLTNLVDNALRYAPVGSTVTLSVSPRAGHVELRVTDEGPAFRRSSDRRC